MKGDAALPLTEESKVMTLLILMAAYNVGFTVATLCRVWLFLFVYYDCI